jgi:hypothetical protein
MNGFEIDSKLVQPRIEVWCAAFVIVVVFEVFLAFRLMYCYVLSPLRVGDLYVFTCDCTILFGLII